MLSVTLLTANKILFEGEATKVIFPADQGVFEVGLFHKTLISRLLPGVTHVDEQEFLIRHGIAKVKDDRVIAMVELESD